MASQVRIYFRFAFKGVPMIGSGTASSCSKRTFALAGICTILLFSNGLRADQPPRLKTDVEV